MRIQIPDVRIAFCDSLFTAKQVNGQGEPRHGAVFIIDPKSPIVKTLDDAIEAVAKEKWGAKAAGILAEIKRKDRVCFFHGPKTNKQGEVYQGFDGMYHVNTSAPQNKRPLVIDRSKSPLSEKDGRVYPGCYVNASLEIWAQDNEFGTRINAQLRGVQYVREGDAFGGGAPASVDEFADLAEGAEAGDLV